MFPPKIRFRDKCIYIHGNFSKNKEIHKDSKIEFPVNGFFRCVSVCIWYLHTTISLFGCLWTILSTNIKNEFFEILGWPHFFPRNIAFLAIFMHIFDAKNSTSQGCQQFRKNQISISWVKIVGHVRDNVLVTYGHPDGSEMRSKNGVFECRFFHLTFFLCLLQKYRVHIVVYIGTMNSEKNEWLYLRQF